MHTQTRTHTHTQPSLYASNLQLAKRGEEACAIRLELAVLTADTKLNREPVHGGELLHVLVACTEGRKSNLLRELGKLAVRKQRHVAQDLVANVWLGRVERARLVTHVLRRVEHAEGKAREKVAGGEEAGDGAEAEPRAVVQKLRNVLELRHIVFAVPAVLCRPRRSGEEDDERGRECACVHVCMCEPPLFIQTTTPSQAPNTHAHTDEEWEYAVELRACVCGVQLCQLLEHLTPVARRETQDEQPAKHHVRH